jgi:hypothetical protein
MGDPFLESARLDFRPGVDGALHLDGCCGMADAALVVSAVQHGVLDVHSAMASLR